MHKPILALPIKNPLLRGMLTKLTRLDGIQGIYQGWLDAGRPGVEDNPAKALLDFALDHMMQVQLAIGQAERLEMVPKTGPLMIVANHPFGALEGMLLTRLLLRIRPDLKVLTNQLLQVFPEFKDVFIGVDVLNTNREQANSSSIRALSKHIGSGGAALVFPAGTVATLELPSLQPHDAPWNALIGRLVLKHHASCLPIFLHGRNSIAFYLSAWIHPRLRTALLPRAMLAKQRTQVRATIGALIEPSDFAAIKDGKAVTQYLRLCCERLADQPAEISGIRSSTAPASAIRADLPTAQLQAKHDTLTTYQVASHGDFVAFCAPHAALGCVMAQLAITRERTFREVEEGTGRAQDEDQFDAHYWHLWIWDQRQQQIVGGYRIAKTDELLQARGIRGLYSRSLYEYDERFLRSLGRSIEVGRSFVAPAYQRHPRTLDLLWKGIGHFITQNPGYHTLFGCVSISKQYSALSRAILADSFLYHYGVDASIRTTVQASSPLPVRKRAWDASLIASLSDVPIINKLLGRLDAGRSIPVLIHHYLALNGKFVSFTVNHGFNQSLDGLILVDLRIAPARYINRYLGDQGAAAFNALHEVKTHAA
jgi:putative hemolysin